jgi:5'-nucleotidase/UDP-sugar diphosphatase
MRYSAFLVFVWLSTPALCASQEPTTKFTLLLTGNTYGYFDVTPVGNDLAGGIVRRKTVVEQVRREVGTDHLLLLDAGNSLGYYYLLRGDQGAAMISAMHELGYDGIAVGNHEFDYGKEPLMAYNNPSTGLNVLAANLNFKGKKDPVFLPYIIEKKADGVRVAIIGLTDPQIEQSILRQHFEGLSIANPLTTALAYLPQLRAQADIIVALTHLTMDDCYKLAIATTGFDVIIARAESITTGPSIRKEGPGTTPPSLIVSPVRYGSAVTRVDLIFNHQRRTTSSSLREYLSINSTIAGDVGFATRLAVGAEQQYYDYSMETYGIDPDEPLLLVDSSFTEQDLIRLALHILLQQTGTEIALLNNTYFRFPGVDFPLYEPDPRYRKITVRVLEQILWTDNELVTMQLTGQQLAALQRASGANKRAGRDNYLLNLQVTGQGNEEWYVHNAPLLQRTPPELYHVVTTNFLAGGGDGFTPFREGRGQASRFSAGKPRREASEHGNPVIVRDLMIRHLKQSHDLAHVQVTDHVAVIDSSYLDRTLWRFTLSRLQLNYSAGQYRANASYGNVSLTELRGVDFERITYEADLRLKQESKLLTWDNRVYALFGRSHISGQPLQEVSDDLFFETIANFRSSKATGSLSLYPSASVRYDTEMTPTESKQVVSGQTLTIKNPRQQDITIGLGVGLSEFAGFSRSRISLTQTFDRSSKPRRDENGINVQTSFAAPIGGALFRSELDGTYYIKQKNSTGDTRRLLVRWRSDLGIPIGRLTLAPSLSVFLFQGQQSPKPGTPPPVATAVVVGITLGYSFDWKMQYESLF